MSAKYRAGISTNTYDLDLKNLLFQNLTTGNLF